MENITRPTVLEVDLQAFLNNIEKIKKFVNPDVKVMPVIKANGYGTYVNTRLEILNQFDIVAIATVDEGVFIRKLGYEKEIFILNQPYQDEIPKIIENRKGTQVVWIWKIYSISNGGIYGTCEDGSIIAYNKNV